MSTEGNSQPVCSSAEEEEEEPGCKSPESATFATVAGEKGQKPPQIRAPDNALQVFSAVEEYQTGRQAG